MSLADSSMFQFTANSALQIQFASAGKVSLKARAAGAGVVISDTAGRLAIDEPLMQELASIESKVQPDQVYPVVDGMTGQDAANSAGAFNKRLELDGVIMTKLDGDARGGGCCRSSMSRKFPSNLSVPASISMLWSHSALRVWPAEFWRWAISWKSPARLTELSMIKNVKNSKPKWPRGSLRCEEFRDLLLKVAKPGLMQKMLGLLPGMGQINQMLAGQDTDREMRKMIGVIDSMTPSERRNPKVIDNSRRNRIAKRCRGACLRCQRAYPPIRRDCSVNANVGLARTCGQNEHVAADAKHDGPRPFDEGYEDQGRHRKTLVPERESQTKRRSREATPKTKKEGESSPSPENGHNFWLSISRYGQYTYTP
jgi:hypothetical protein